MLLSLSNFRRIGNTQIILNLLEREKADYLIKDVESESEGFRFKLRTKKNELLFRTPLPGKYNIHNLTAGIITGLHMGISEQKIRDAVAVFNGVERRLRKIGVRGDSVLYEDFAHHPTSIAEVLQSLKELHPERKLTALFEPASWSLKNKYFKEKSSMTHFPQGRINPGVKRNFQFIIRKCTD